MSETLVALPDLAATDALGRRIAAVLRVGDVVALSGGLGAGKTTLARAIIAALGHEGDVPSPSFAIIQPYADLSVPLVHADFYRIEDPREALELGLDDYRSESAMIAEWPENIGGFDADPACLTIGIENGEGARAAIVRAGANWLERWQ